VLEMRYRNAIPSLYMRTGEKGFLERHEDENG
jgi:hypothetical protein